MTVRFESESLSEFIRNTQFDLNPKSWASIRPSVVGNGNKSAALMCAWDALSYSPLNAAHKEVLELSSLFKNAGYQFIPDNEAVVGDKATPEALNKILSSDVSVVHYAGHGSKVGDESVLMLRPNDGDKNAFVDFGRSDIWHLTRILERKKLFDNTPFFFLNSCQTGSAHEQGGYRMDLVSELLRQGTGSVISTALPTSDHYSQIITLAFYQKSLNSDNMLCESLIEARKIMLDHLRRDSPGFQALWAFITYNGNPFLRLSNVN